MLISDFMRNIHANVKKYFFLHALCFSSTLTSNRRQFQVKLKSILNQIFILVFL